MLPSIADLVALTGHHTDEPIASIRLGPRPLAIAEDMLLSDASLSESESEPEGAAVDSPPTKRQRAVSSTKPAKTRKQYKMRTKIKALQELNLKSQSVVQKEFGISHGTLANWVRVKEAILASSLPLSRRRLWGGGRMSAITFGQVRYFTIISRSVAQYTDTDTEHTKLDKLWIRLGFTYVHEGSPP